MQWHYIANGDPVGPLTDAECKACIADGTITNETLVWNETMTDWAALSSLDASTDAAVRPQPEPRNADVSEMTFCASCNQPHPVDTMIQYEGAYVCAACKPTFFQRVEQGAPLPGTIEYGGFWIRFAAKVLDQLILSAIITPLSMIIMFAMFAAITASGATTNNPQNSGAFISIIVISYVVMFTISFAIPVVYHIWLVGKYGATLGKMACRLRIVRPDTTPLTYKRACGRYFAEMVTDMTMGIGYIIAAFDDEKKTLHDIMCDTRVIKHS